MNLEGEKDETSEVAGIGKSSHLHLSDITDFLYKFPNLLLRRAIG